MHRNRGAATTGPANEQLGDKNRNGNKDDAGDVNDHKRSAATYSGDVRELPDIAEANCGANGRQHKRDAG